MTKAGIVAPGLTELRVTFAAARKRETEANDSQVAAALGDRDTCMGAHYTRHVEKELLRGKRSVSVFRSDNLRSAKSETGLETGMAPNWKQSFA